MKITLMQRSCIIKAIAEEISHIKKIKYNDNIKTKSNDIATESKIFLQENGYVLFSRSLYPHKENVQCWRARLKESFLDVEILEVIQDALSLDKYLKELKQNEFSYKKTNHQRTKVDKDFLPEIEMEQELHVFKICFF